MIALRCAGCQRLNYFQLWRNTRRTVWPIEVACRCGLARLVNLLRDYNFVSGRLALGMPFRVRWAP